MKQQLLEKRQTLIAHLEQKIQALSQYRNSICQPQQEQKNSANSHINISNYLNKQLPHSKSQVRNKPVSANKQKFAQPVANPIRTHSKADIIRQQLETKQKLVELQKLYHRKKQLQSIGVLENNAKKINSMFNNKQTKKTIDKKLEQNKKEQKIKEQKDKIIQQQLHNVKKFLNQTKTNNKSRKAIPEKHFSLIFATNTNKLEKITKLINKTNLNQVEKDQLLWQIFQALKQKSSLSKIVSKQSLRQFLLSNEQFCGKFYITKNEIMRDLDVYQTAQTGALTYTEFYQFTKSIQITNLALKPNLKFKTKLQTNDEGQTSSKGQLNKKDETIKQMESYLKKLYTYLDNKNERVVQRIKLQLALKKSLLFDEKKYKLLKKSDIEKFAQKVEKSRHKVKDTDYYKTLDIKYIGLEQILHLNKEAVKKEISELSGNIENTSQQSISQRKQEDLFTEEKQIEQQEQVDLVKVQLKPQLQSQDFERYGWQQSEDKHQSFKNIQQIDRYYKQVRNKYGNEIAWNGIEHYREDFSKFNDCIKQMNIKHDGKDTKP